MKKLSVEQFQEFIQDWFISYADSHIGEHVSGNSFSGCMTLDGNFELKQLASELHTHVYKEMSPSTIVHRGDPK